MKTPFDPRHLKRRRLVRSLFAGSFTKQSIIEEGAKAIFNHQEKIDAFIKKAAPEWPIEKINKIDLAILRLAIFELKIVKKEPPKVIIDEAVELAKEFGSESSSAFVNGTLGTLLKEENEAPSRERNPSEAKYRTVPGEAESSSHLFPNLHVKISTKGDLDESKNN